MASFYNDPHSHEDINSRWIKHIQNNAYIQDIGNIVDQNRIELQKTMEHTSNEHINVMRQVCGKLDDGFDEVNQHLKDINFNISDLRGEINDMASMIDWNFTQLIEEQRLTNQLLGEITKLLRIPDSQRQRVYYIEQGLKYLKNAIIEGGQSAFYIDSLESFKEAEKIERKDYITLNRIGYIYLYSEKHLNITLAEEYFMKSAREASAEDNVDGTTVSNHLIPAGHDSLIYSQYPYKAAAAEAYIYASRACYLQHKNKEAADLAGKAFILVPEYNDAGFEQAKYLAANNQEVEAVKVLERVIKNDRYFSIKTLGDQDLITKPAVLELLENLQKITISKANTGYKECKAIMKINSKAEQLIDEIESDISKNNFLSGMKALDLLNADYTLPFKIYKEGDEVIRWKALSPKQKIIEYVKKEKASAKEFEIVENNVKNKTIKGRVAMYGYGAAFIGFFIGFFNGCSVSSFSMDWGTLFWTIIGFGGAGAIIGYFHGQTIEPGSVNDNSINY